MINRFYLLLSLFWNSVLQNAIDKALEFLVDFFSWYFEAIFRLSSFGSRKNFRPLFWSLIKLLQLQPTVPNTPSHVHEISSQKQTN